MNETNNNKNDSNIQDSGHDINIEICEIESGVPSPRAQQTEKKHCSSKVKYCKIIRNITYNFALLCNIVLMCNLYYDIPYISDYIPRPLLAPNGTLQTNQNDQSIYQVDILKAKKIEVENGLFSSSLQSSKLTILSNADIRGKLNATGKSSLNGVVTKNIESTSLQSNSLTIVNNANIGGTLDVTGKTSINNDIVTQNIESTSLQSNSLNIVNNANIGGTLDITGKASLNGDIVTQNIESTSLQSNSLYNIINNANIGGTLDVTGKTSINNDIVTQNIESTSLQSNSLNIVNNANIGGTLIQIF